MTRAERRSRGAGERVDTLPRAVAPVVAALAVLAHWPLLRLRGTYWDDWVLLRSDLEMFTFTGRVEFAHLHRFLLTADDPVRLARFLQLGLWAVAAVLLLGCLRRLPWITPRTAVLAACIFAVIPTYSARVTQIMLPSTIAFVVFLAFWSLLLATSPQRLTALRGVGLLGLAAASYSLLSLLVFTAVAFSSWVWTYGGPRAVWRTTHSRALLAALVASPVVYYAARAVLLPSSGTYEQYNAFTAPGAAIATGTFLLNIPALLFATLFQGFTVSVVLVAGVAAVAALALARAGVTAPVDPEAPRRSMRPAAAFGVVCGVLGVVPYLVVGKPPILVDWHSRHQLLLTVGLAIVIAAVVHRLFGDHHLVLGVAGAVVLASMVVSGWGTYGDFAIDTARQAALASAIKGTEELDDARLIVLDLDHELVDAAGRQPRYYAMSHLVRDALALDRRDLLVLFGDPRNAGSADADVLRRAVTPFPGDAQGLRTVDLTRPARCAAVAVASQPRPGVTLRSLPALLVDGVGEIPEFSIRRVRHGCDTPEVREKLAPLGARA